MRNKGRKIRALEAEVTDLRMRVDVLAAEVAMLRAYTTPIAAPPAPGVPPPYSPVLPQIWCQESSDTIASEARTDA